MFPTLLELYWSWILVPCGALLVNVPGFVVEAIPVTEAHTVGAPEVPPVPPPVGLPTQTLLLLQVSPSLQPEVA